MDAGTIAAHGGAAFASGLIITLAITFATLPASFLMNRFIYHHWLMRLVIGAVGGVMGFGAFVIILGLVMTGKWGKAHYFGLFPITEKKADGILSGWGLPLIGHAMIPLKRLFEYVHDEPAYTAAVEQLLVKKDEAAVVEDLFAGAREAAAMEPDRPARGDQPAVWTSYSQMKKGLQAMIPQKPV